MNTVRVAERGAEWPHGVTREECIRLMVREAAALWFPNRVAELESSALERELVESTYFGRGLAVPHARVAGLPTAAVYVAKGVFVPWPEESADCVALLCVPLEQPELHLQLLSRIMRWRMKGGALQFD